MRQKRAGLPALFVCPGLFIYPAEEKAVRKKQGKKSRVKKQGEKKRQARLAVFYG